MTYLELVNDVLARLREPSVTSVTQTAYSTLIGKYINDIKRQVEDAWNWDVLDTVLTVTTSAGTSLYTVTGSSNRHKAIRVNDASSKGTLSNVPFRWIQDQQQLTTVQQGAPVNYAWSGTDGTDSKVTLFPTPDGAYTIYFNMIVPQAALVIGGDVLKVPSEPVILGAYARAIVERGEDGGLNSSEAYALYKSSLADHIALESTRQTENDCWVPV